MAWTKAVAGGLCGIALAVLVGEWLLFRATPDPVDSVGITSVEIAAESNTLHGTLLSSARIYKGYAYRIAGSEVGACND